MTIGMPPTVNIMIYEQLSEEVGDSADHYCVQTILLKELRPALCSKSTKTRTISIKLDRAYFDMYQPLTLAQRFSAPPSHFH
jgi:hypothetical protein